MRILLKFPTRSRPEKAYATLSKYVEMAGERTKLGILVSADVDDTSMTNSVTKERFEALGKKVEWFKMAYSPNKTKIEACNADMASVDYPWDIMVLVSDDMIPQEHGYDMKIRLYMRTRFPDTDGILWFSDGLQKENLNTLSIMGRKMYASFGYIYHPAYKSFYCDTEFTDLCNGTLKHKCVYVSYCIIKHEHPSSGKGAVDSLYMRNDRYWYDDLHTYITRKQYAYEWSVLIPTIPGREQSLAHLQHSIREKIARICPDLRYEIRVEFDNRVMSIGMKRQKLLDSAQGKYISFIDDDDDITDAYIEDLRDCIRGNYHVMQLTGKIDSLLFVHKLSVKPTDKMATYSELQRPPNHLNPMLTEIARTVRFQDAIRGEDLDWAIRLSRMSYLQTEYSSAPGRVHYIYNLGSRTVDPRILEGQRQLTAEEMLKQVFVTKESKPTSIQETRLRLGPRGFVSR
jgi:hypothetical protein